MVFSFYRFLQISFCIFLLAKAFIQFTQDPDWWIYVPVYSMGAVVCLFPFFESKIWRTLSALTIVFGGLQVAFTSWSLWHASKATTAEPFEEVRHVALSAAAVSMTSGVRLSTTKPRDLFSCLRIIVLMIALISSSAAFMYSVWSYTSPLLYR